MTYPTVTFLDSPAKVVSAVVNRPAWGYESEIHMPIVVSQAHDGTYSFFDPLDITNTTLGTFDYRVLKSSLWRMTNQQKNDFNAFMRSADKGRAQNMVMRLSAAGVYTGFYPFLPDMCDNGDYTVRELSRDQSGKLMRPFKWYEDDLSLVMVTRGGVSFSAYARSEGDFYIGSIGTGFMYPQNGITVSSTYCFDTQLSMSGAPSSVNGPLAGDSWEASFELQCNTYNAAALVEEITLSRTSDIILTVPDHFDMFGADQSLLGAGGTFKTKFLGSSRTDKEIVLSMKHIGVEQFLVPMTFWMKEKIA